MALKEVSSPSPKAKFCMRGAEPQARIDMFDSVGILGFGGGGWPFPLLSESFGRFLEAIESCEVKVVFSR